jgi:hypothetical protein
MQPTIVSEYELFRPGSGREHLDIKLPTLPERHDITLFRSDRLSIQEPRVERGRNGGYSLARHHLRIIADPDTEIVITRIREYFGRKRCDVPKENPEYSVLYFDFFRLNPKPCSSISIRRVHIGFSTIPCINSESDLILPIHRFVFHVKKRKRNAYLLKRLRKNRCRGSLPPYVHPRSEDCGEDEYEILPGFLFYILSHVSLRTPRNSGLDFPKL